MAMGIFVVPTWNRSITPSTPGKRLPVATPTAMARKIHSVRNRSRKERRLVGRVDMTAPSGFGWSGEWSSGGGAFASGTQAREILLKNIDLPQTRGDTIEQSATQAGFRGGERIVHPLSFSPSRHQPGVSEPGQVSRHLWLTEFQDLAQLAHAKLPLREQVQ